MGRKPKSRKEKLLNGNPGKRPLDKDHAKLTAASVAPPAWLDTLGKNFWKSLAPELSDKGLLSVADYESFATLCQAYSDYREAVAILRAEGKTVPTGNDSVKDHPAVGQQKRALEAFTKMSIEFGLTPRSRSAITLEIEDELDPFEEFNKGAGE